MYREGTGKKMMMPQSGKGRVHHSGRHAGRNIQYTVQKLNAFILPLHNIS